MSNTLTAVSSLDKELDKLGDTTKNSAREMNQLEKAAKRLVDQNLTPQEKYNQKLELMAKAVKAGKLSMDDATRTADRMRAKLDDVGKSSQKVFGGESVAKWVAGLGGATALLAGIKAAFAGVEKQSQDAADSIFQSYGSFAALQAVSGTQQEFAANVAFARDLVSRGVVAPQRQGQAADITAGLVKARLTAPDRETIAAIGQSDILQPEELVPFAEGIREFRDVFKAAGSFRDVANQLIETGRGAKATPGEVGHAATKFGRAAADKGFSPEDALAAYSAIIQTSPNARTAATRTEKFFKGDYKMTPVEAGIFKQQGALIRSAPGRDPLGTQGGLARTDPLLSATDILQTSQGELSQIYQSKTAEKEILFDIVRAARERQAVQAGGILGRLDVWGANNIMGGIFDLLGAENASIRGALRQDFLNEDEKRQLLDYLKRTAESNEQMNQGVQAPSPSGRQEP